MSDFDSSVEAGRPESGSRSPERQLRIDLLNTFYTAFKSGLSPGDTPVHIVETMETAAKDADVEPPSEQDGLYGKYAVFEDGEPVEGCFVLEPESDPAALAAMKTYAQATDDHELAEDLEAWIAAIEDAGGEDGE